MRKGSSMLARRRSIALGLMIVFFASVLAMGSAPASAAAPDSSPISIDGVLTEGEWDGYFWFTDSSAGPGTGYLDNSLPVFSGYVTNDDEFLYMAFDVVDNTPNTNRDFLYVTIDMPPVGVFNEPVDALYWGSIPTNPSFFGEAYLTVDAFPWDRSQRASTWGTDGGVVTARTITDTNRYYELRIPLSAIGAVPGDIIGLKVQARGGQYASTTDPQVVNYYPDMPDGITPIRSDTRVEVEGNFEHLILHCPDNIPPLAPSLVSPDNEAVTTDNTPTFDWTSVTDPSGVTYQIQIDDNDDFSSPVYSEIDLTAITHTLPDEGALALGAYFWHVRAVDGAGNVGDWSEEWNFTVVPVGAIGVLLMPLLMLLPFALMLRRQNRRYHY